MSNRDFKIPPRYKTLLMLTLVFGPFFWLAFTEDGQWRTDLALMFVLGKEDFNPALDGLLDSPHYTRPEVWQGEPVPEALLSGHHARIERWRREQSLTLTARHRPELIDQARAAGRLDKADEAFLRGLPGQDSAKN